MTGYRDYVDEAIAELGFIKPDAAVWIEEHAKRYGRGHGGDVARTARTMGTPMTKGERSEAGLGNLKMTREAWDALTDLGKQDPARALSDTFIRVITGYNRDRQNREAMSRNDDPRVVIEAWDPCPEFLSSGLKNTVVAKTDAPTFPLPACSRVSCDCRIRPYYDYEREMVMEIDAPDHAPKRRKSLFGRLLRAVGWVFGVLLLLGIISNMMTN